MYPSWNTTVVFEREKKDIHIYNISTTYLKIFRDLLFRPLRTEASFSFFHVAWFVDHYSSSSLSLRWAITSVESEGTVPYSTQYRSRSMARPMALPGYSLRGREVKTTLRLFIDIEATAPFPPFGIRRNPQRWDLRFTPLQQGLVKSRRRSPDIGYASFSRDDIACLLARRNRVISLEKTCSHRCVKHHSQIFHWMHHRSSAESRKP